MISTDKLEQLTVEYLKNCNRQQAQPTFRGLGEVLSVSGQTIANVVHGKFNGHDYTDAPHTTRIIDNKDFNIIRDIFFNI